jgi:hypothetical protein
MIQFGFFLKCADLSTTATVRIDSVALVTAFTLVFQLILRK